MYKFIMSLAIMAVPLIFAAQAVDEDRFLETLRGEIQKQSDLVNKLKDQIARTDIVAPSSINTQFENAYTMLNVKRTLYANFVGTPSIKSPLVQKKLLQIFQKDIITQADLSELEALVKQERPKFVTPSEPTAPAGQ